MLLALCQQACTSGEMQRQRRLILDNTVRAGRRLVDHKTTANRVVAALL